MHRLPFTPYVMRLLIRLPHYHKEAQMNQKLTFRSFTTERLTLKIRCEIFESYCASGTSYQFDTATTDHVFRPYFCTIKPLLDLLFWRTSGGVDPESIEGFVHRVLALVLQIFHLHCKVLCLVAVDPKIVILCFLFTSSYFLILTCKALLAWSVPCPRASRSGSSCCAAASLLAE